MIAADNDIVLGFMVIELSRLFVSRGDERRKIMVLQDASNDDVPITAGEEQRLDMKAPQEGEVCPSQPQGAWAGALLYHAEGKYIAVENIQGGQERGTLARR